MSDGDDLRHDSLGAMGWYRRGQQDQQQQDHFRRVVQRFCGTGPEAELAAFAAENERLINYANDLVQEVNALQRENATVRNQYAALSNDYRVLRAWSTTAEAELARQKTTIIEFADESNDQICEIADLKETIERLEAELAELRQNPVRTD
jgi:chromosome segregation ATPase